MVVSSTKTDHWWKAPITVCCCYSCFSSRPSRSPGLKPSEGSKCETHALLITAWQKPSRLAAFKYAILNNTRCSEGNGKLQLLYLLLKGMFFLFHFVLFSKYFTVTFLPKEQEQLMQTPQEGNCKNKKIEGVMMIKSSFRRTAISGGNGPQVISLECEEWLCGTEWERVKKWHDTFTFDTLILYIKSLLAAVQWCHRCLRHCGLCSPTIRL